MAAAFGLSAWPQLRAQTAASLGAGASIVQYEGFLTSGAATLTPAVTYDGAHFRLAGQGSWTVFESGNQIIQATTAGAWFVAARERWWVELSGNGGVSKYAEAPATGHLLGRGRVHLSERARGVWLSTGTGGSFAGSTEVPLEVSIGAWRTRSGYTLTTALTATWLADQRHVDVSAAARWTIKRVELEAQAGARLVAVSNDDVATNATGVSGEVSALVPLGSRLSLAMSGGSYPSDPVRNTLGATYVTAGFQLSLARPATPVAASMPPAPRARTRPDNPSTARLEIVSTGGQRVFRVYAAGATRVELMGDFTDWEPVALVQIDQNQWELRLDSEPGVHRLNIRIDGGAWIVPDGARVEQDEFGAAVGVIVLY